MTKPLPPVLEYLIDDVLADEEITTKRMFGGFGVYYHGTIFAGMMNGELHLKAPNDQVQKEFEDAGGIQFTYTFKNTGRTSTMPYWKVPDEIMIIEMN